MDCKKQTSAWLYVATMDRVDSIAQEDKRPCSSFEGRCFSGVMTEHRLALKAVKAFHTFAWFTIEACMVFVLYAGIRGKSDRRAGQAADIYLPKWFAHNLPAIHVPLIILAVFLHTRNLRPARPQSLGTDS